ncbi:DUF2490 domain-containing protein [Fulvitalea axinellae]
MIRLSIVPFLASLFLLASSSVTVGQTVDQFNSWWFYSGKYILSDHYSMRTLYAWSRHDFVNVWQQSKLRMGIERRISRNFNAGAGYEWVVLFPYGEHPVPEKRTEHRVYEEITFKTKQGRFGLNTGILLEHRFMERNRRDRLRFKVGANFPWLRLKSGKNESGSQSLGIVCYNQFFINLGSAAKNVTLGQNRIYIGLDFQIIKGVKLGLGYMNQLIRIKENKAENNHTIVVGFSHKMDFTKK